MLDINHNSHSRTVIHLEKAGVRKFRPFYTIYTTWSAFKVNTLCAPGMRPWYSESSKLSCEAYSDKSNASLNFSKHQNSCPNLWGAPGMQRWKSAFKVNTLCAPGMRPWYSESSKLSCEGFGTAHPSPAFSQNCCYIFLLFGGG